MPFIYTDNFRWKATGNSSFLSKRPLPPGLLLLQASFCTQTSSSRNSLPQPPATSLLRTSTGGPWMAAPSFQQVTTLCSGLRLREGLNHHLLASNFLPKALRRKPDTSLEKRQAVTLHEYVPGHGGKRGVDVTNSNHSGSWGLLPTF